MDQGFDTTQLPGTPDVVAPDGSDVRILLRRGRGRVPDQDPVTFSASHRRTPAHIVAGVADSGIRQHLPLAASPASRPPAAET